jgi:hypothetical protein
MFFKFQVVFSLQNAQSEDRKKVKMATKPSRLILCGHTDKKTLNHDLKSNFA